MQRHPPAPLHGRARCDRRHQLAEALLVPPPSDAAKRSTRQGLLLAGPGSLPCCDEVFPSGHHILTPRSCCRAVRIENMASGWVTNDTGRGRRLECFETLSRTGPRQPLCSCWQPCWHALPPFLGDVLLAWHWPQILSVEAPREVVYKDPDDARNAVQSCKGILRLIPAFREASLQDGFHGFHPPP